MNEFDYGLELDEDDSSFDPTVMRSGIPKSIDKILPLDEDNADLVYRNLDVMKNYSVRRVSDGDSSDNVLVCSLSIDRKQPAQSIMQSTAPTKPAVIIAAGGKYQLAFAESLQMVISRIEGFLLLKSITFTHRLESSTHCWDCYTISNNCQLLKFVIQVVNGSECVMVDFKRERGCSDTLTTTFDDFQRHTGTTSSTKGGRFRSVPLPLPDDDFDVDVDSCVNHDQAIYAMVSWIQSSPVEALQSLGQLYGSKCQQLLKCEQILKEVCHSIRAHEVGTSDIVALSIAISCLRKILSVHSELGSSSPITEEHIKCIAGGLKRASGGKDLTAKREALTAVETLHSTVKSAKQLLNM